MSKKDNDDQDLEDRLKKLKGETPTLEELENRLDKLKDRKSTRNLTPAPQNEVDKLMEQITDEIKIEQSIKKDNEKKHQALQDRLDKLKGNKSQHSNKIKSTGNSEVDGIVKKAFLDARVDKEQKESSERKKQEAKENMARLDANSNKTLEGIYGKKQPSVTAKSVDISNKPKPLKSSEAKNPQKVNLKVEHKTDSQAAKRSLDNLPKKQPNLKIWEAIKKIIFEPIKKFFDKAVGKESSPHTPTKYSNNTENYKRSNEEVLHDFKEMMEPIKEIQKIADGIQKNLTNLAQKRNTGQARLGQKRVEQISKVGNKEKKSGGRSF
ncbi:hypothetical protein [Rickettsia endosymbiont of Halotydeus destructor]|uniref:hypothetical protein n=1 Tax=Rickettsia endosymbiont of Halotydeus destructor TaxID=2996754 RepID=UPI003BAF5B90